jgi:hypothetical protein
MVAGSQRSRVRLRFLAMLTLVSVPVGCGGGAPAGVVAEGWAATADGELRYAVPADANRSEPPRDPQARTEHVLGDPDDETSPSRIGDDAVGEADIDALFASVSVDG